MSLEYVFAPGTANELILDENEIISHNPIKTHTGKADARLTIEETRELDAYAQRQDRVNAQINGTVQWTGYVISISHNTGRAQSILRLDGIAKKLEETRPDYDSLGGPLTYNNIAIEDAIDDYWGRTPFGNYTVKSQPAEQVANDDNVQSLDTTTEFDNAITIDDDTLPFQFANSELELTQTSFVKEGENPNNTTPGFTQDPDFSGGEAAVLGTSTSQSYEYNFTLDHTIPADDYAIGIRWKGPSVGGNIPDLRWEIDGEQVSTFSAATDGAINWREDIIATEGSPPSNDLSAGQHTLTVRTEATGDQFELDVVQNYDNGDRFGGFNYNYDGDNGGNDGYLDGPELYPDGVSITWDPVEVSYNITGARVDSEWSDNDVSGAQQIELSNDGGSTWQSFSNAEDGSVTFNTTDGRTITARTTHDRYGSTTGQTPLTGVSGQSIDVWNLFLDGNNKAVIDTLELSRNHFDNLKTLHNYGDYIWVISHDGGTIANMEVNSFEEGDSSKPTPTGFDDPQNKESEVQAGNYYNVIYLQGSKDDQGNRPSAEVKADQSVINNDGREISPGVLRDPDITTEAGAVFRARALLDAAQSNNDLVGTVTVPPTDLSDPGFTREVSFDPDESPKEKTVEEVSLTEQPQNVQVRFTFGLPEELSEDISELKREARQIGDRV